MLVTYDSIPEFIAIARHCRYKENSNEAGSWYGNMSHDTAVRLSLEGDDKFVPEAEKLLDKLDASIEINRPEWQPSIAGAFPVVPEFLAGAPDCMRMRVNVSSDLSPVRVYVSTTCSGMIDHGTMLKRGVAILALVMKLQQVRPVELFLLAETHGQTDGEYIQVIRVESQPINLSVACHVLANVGFARHLTYGVAKVKDSFNGAWPNTYRGGGDPWEAHIRELLAMTPNDLYIGAARAWDDMITKPVEWVNAHVARLSQALEVGV